MTSYRTPALRVIGHALWIGSLLTLLAIIAVSVWLDSTTGGYGLTSVLLTIRLYGITRLPTSAALSVLIGALTAAAMNTRSRIARAGILAGGYALVMVLLDALVQLTYHASAWSKWLTPPLSLWIIVTAAGAAGLAWRQRKQDLRLSSDGRKMAWRAIAVGLAMVLAWQSWQVANRYRASNHQTTSQTATPSVTSYLKPVPSIPAVRDELSALYDSTVRAAPPDLRWSIPLAMSENPCSTPSGADGSMFALTGRFTVRDLNHPVDSVDLRKIVEENKVVAEQIANAWIADGLMNNPKTVLGSWYFEVLETETLATAKIEFLDGYGNILVLSKCAT